MKTKLLMERLDAIERQALETLKEVRAKEQYCYQYADVPCPKAAKNLLSL